jgi:hypothetical protein
MASHLLPSHSNTEAAQQLLLAAAGVEQPLMHWARSACCQHGHWPAELSYVAAALQVLLTYSEVCSMSGSCRHHLSNGCKST